jgi:hypothetical protein
MQLHVTDRVSTTMKRLGIAVLIAAIIGAVWYLQRTTPKTSAAAMHEPAPVERPAPAPIGKVTKLGSVEERKLLAERIEKARATRAKGSTTAMATSAPAAPRLPDEATPISTVEIRTAMREVIPILTECYEAALPSLPDPRVEITAEMKLTGDPDIGTVIDAKQITDKAGQPLPAKFDDCLRSTFQTLALPPLTEGDEIDVRYPFVFDEQ